MRNERGRAMSIYFVGDTHGGINERKLYPENFPNYESCSKKDTLIQLGDFGYIWDTDTTKSHERIKRMKNVFENKNWGDVFVCFGNHENYNLIEQYPIEEKNGGRVYRISDNIYGMLRGEVYTIDGYKIFSCGGASSIDKNSRTLNIDYFKQEDLTYSEIENALSNLEKHNNTVDFIVSHTCSASTLERMCSYFNMYLGEFDTQNIFLEDIKHRIRWKYWLFGHFHQDIAISKNELCVFEHILSTDDIGI